MSRYIDANNVIAYMRQVLDAKPDEKDTVAYFAYEQFIKLLNLAPTADVVEVVRCKDCKHQPNLKTGTKGMMWCRKFRNEVTAIDFCSYGEQKGDQS